MLEIMTGVEIPQRGKRQAGLAALADRMAVGDCVECTKGQASNLAIALRRIGYGSTQRTQDNGKVRVWKVAR